MRGLIFATFLALTATQSFAAPPQCPPPGTEEVLLPNPADCTTFYKCTNGVLYLMSCPGGLEWNSKISQCDYPANAQCKETEEKPTTVSTTTVTGPTTTSKPRPDKCPDVDGPEDVLLPNPEDCNSFFKCLKGEPVLLKCPEGQEWSIELNRCDFPEIAKCVVTGTNTPTKPPSSTTVSSSRPPPPDKCPAENGPEDVLLPNPADCGSFFKCLNGVPHLINCPPGQEWSIDLNRCDFPEIAQCVPSVTNPGTKPTTTSTTSKPPSELPDKCPEEDGPVDVLLPNPYDCNSFYKCLNGIPHLIPCPEGQQWSIELSRCDFPHIAQCKEIEEEKFIPIVPKPQENSCPAEDGPEDVLLPNPADCGSFFKCLAGTPVLHKCPPGLKWSTELTRCEYPEIAKCVETETSVKPETTTSGSTSTSKPPVERPDHCPAEDGPEDVLLPNPYDCGSFFKCLGGVPQLIPCPQGLQWSVELNRCDYPNIAQCKEEEEEDNIEIKPRPTPDGCPAEDGPEDVLLPNPADCGSFYKCLAGTPVLHKCPPGLQWSTELTRCEYPEIAKCIETESTVKPESTTSSSTSSSKPPVERPNQCPAEDGPEDVLLPNPDDCGSFFKCLGGHPELIACPAGLHWSIELNRCEYPAVAKCEKKNFMKLLLRDSECPSHNEGMDIFFPNPKNCSTYYQCSNGVKILKECGVGTLWDAEMQRCDHKNVAKCATEEKYYIPEVKAEEKDCPVHNSGYDIFFPNPEDCTTFWQCSNGEKILMRCPPGTLWWAQSQRCDYKHIAVCA